MAQHKSAEKRNRQNQKRNTRNTALRSRMRKAVKAAREAIEGGSADKAKLVADAIREVQKAGSKNVVGANTVSRYVSRLARAANR